MTSPWILVLLAFLGSSYADDMDVEQRLLEMEDQITTLARHFMKQQFHQEDKLRAEGDSGVKRIRLNNAGTKPYHHTSHTMRSMASAHDHDNHDRTVGLGELHMVLNGWDFRTRHNDYALKMPSRNSTDYHATEDIPFPEVPPAVTQLSSVTEQIIELREWFKAWRDQNHTVRDYRPYFKPVLSYLEGAWEYSQDDIEESFESDRHFLDASSWAEMDEKVAFMAHTGRKDSNENFASLPTKLMSVENGSLVFARWNYRILSHPLENDLPLNQFCFLDDLAIRMAYKRTKQEQLISRAARFQLDPFEDGQCKDGAVKHGLLDKLMAEVPGMDNYPGHAEDTTFDETAFDFVQEVVNGTETDVALNAAYYHRWYRLLKKGALGLKSRSKTFADPTLFMSQTTSPKVVKYGVRILNKQGKLIKEYQQRWSYAVPLEIVYLTPLLRWNPFNIVHHGDAKSTEGKSVSADKRNGKTSIDKAFNGTNSAKFYHTPASFFSENEDDSDPADSALKGAIGVLNSTGDLCLVRPSGVRINVPEIPGVGYLRTRYNIMPIHGEGYTVWKELSALGDAILNPSAYEFMFSEQPPPSSNDGSGGSPNPQTSPPSDDRLHFLVGPSDVPPEHTHFVDLTPTQTSLVLNASTVIVNTTEAEGHVHEIEFGCTRIKNGECVRGLMEQCDGRQPGWKCADKHSKYLEMISSEERGDVSDTV